MNPTRSLQGLVLMVFALLATPIFGQQAHEQHNHNGEQGYTLLEVMQKLGVDFARLGEGILLQDLETVAAAAYVIVHHGSLSAAERARINATLGTEMALFRVYDTAVHDIAASLGQAAEQGKFNEVARWHGQLLQACVNCHNAFRTRLQIQAPDPSP